jgi:hypothetical protein
MTRQLLESIIAGDMLEASNMLNTKLDEIRASKMYEAKKRFAAEMDEAAGGGLTKQEIEDRKKAGYLPAHKVLGDPSKSHISAATKKYRKTLKKKLAEAAPDVELDASEIKKAKASRAKTSLRRKIGATVVKGIRKAIRASGGDTRKFSGGYMGSRKPEDNKASSDTQQSAQSDANANLEKQGNKAYEFGKNTTSAIKKGVTGVFGDLLSSTMN